MKEGISLQALATELDRQKEAKRDFVAPTSALEMIGRNPPELYIKNHGDFKIGKTAHDQIANRVGIPVRYYHRMREEAPGLLSENVNHWFGKTPENRMVRTLDGSARAFLSDRFRPLDNFDLAEPAIRTLTALKCDVKSCQLTEKRMYIKAVCTSITEKIVGDIVEAGVMISNSEIGHGSLAVEPFIFKLSCSNGMVVNSLSMKKYHVGRGMEMGGEGAQEFFSSATRKADDKAFFLKVGDIIRGTFSKDLFSGMVGQMRLAATRPIKSNLDKVVEIVEERYHLSEDESGGVLQHLIKGGDLTHWGLVNAITRTAQDADDYDRATDLERLGGEVLELPKASWDMIGGAGKN